MDDKWITKTSQKEQKKYYCKIVSYVTNKKSNYDRHILTAKHQSDDKWITKNEPSEPTISRCLNVVVVKSINIDKGCISIRQNVIM